MNRIVLQLLFVTALCVLTILATEPTQCSLTVGADEKQPVTVQCPLTEQNIVWKKDGVVISAGDKKYSMDANNRTLTIVKIDKVYSGEFVCSTGDNKTETLTVCVSPHVEQYDKPKNVIEGDPFQTDCNAWGYPEVTVVWTSDKNFTGAEDRVVYKNGSTINSVLRIDNVKYEDSGFYTCTVRNNLGATANATIQVNVKDKLAALWPFLGICAEVAILCVIIFFYERRRAKILEKEAAQADEAERMTANNDAKVSDDVRHRK